MGRQAVRKEASKQGGCSHCALTRAYQQVFDGEVLQSSVPGRVKDNRQCLVWGLDIANLYFILGRENGRKAGTHATWVLASCTEMGSVESSTLSPLVAKEGHICVGCWTPEEGL